MFKRIMGKKTKNYKNVKFTNKKQNIGKEELEIEIKNERRKRKNKKLRLKKGKRKMNKLGLIWAKLSSNWD